MSVGSTNTKPAVDYITGLTDDDLESHDRGALVALLQSARDALIDVASPELDDLRARLAALAELWERHGRGSIAADCALELREVIEQDTRREAESALEQTGPRRCSACDGSGAAFPSGTCPECDGEGVQRLNP